MIAEKLVALDAGRYKQWLRNIVDPENKRHLDVSINTAWVLLFHVNVLMDRNREIDVLELRNRFTKELNTSLGNPIPEDLIDGSFTSFPVSIFEILVVMATHMASLCWSSEDDDNKIPEMFLKLLGNLGVTAGTTYPELLNIYTKFNNRSYEFNGRGGLYPLMFPREDQRNVELYYQMHAWFAENPGVISGEK